MSEAVKGRLLNWKFESAYRQAVKDGMTGQPLEKIAVLSRSFGDSGYFSGDMAMIVGMAVDCLLGVHDA